METSNTVTTSQMDSTDVHASEETEQFNKGVKLICSETSNFKTCVSGDPVHNTVKKSQSNKEVCSKESSLAVDSTNWISILKVHNPQQKTSNTDNLMKPSPSNTLQSTHMQSGLENDDISTSETVNNEQRKILEVNSYENNSSNSNHTENNLHTIIQSSPKKSYPKMKLMREYNVSDESSKISDIHNYNKPFGMVDSSSRSSSESESSDDELQEMDKQMVIETILGKQSSFIISGAQKTIINHSQLLEITNDCQLETADTTEAGNHVEFTCDSRKSQITEIDSLTKRIVTDIAIKKQLLLDATEQDACSTSEESCEPTTSESSTAIFEEINYIKDINSISSSSYSDSMELPSSSTDITIINTQAPIIATDSEDSYEYQSKIMKSKSILRNSKSNVFDKSVIGNTPINTLNKIVTNVGVEKTECKDTVVEKEIRMESDDTLDSVALDTQETADSDDSIDNSNVDLNASFSDHLVMDIDDVESMDDSVTENDAVSQNLNDDMSENLNDAASQNLNDDMCENLNDAASENLNDAASENLNDAASENLNDAASDNLNDAASENLNDDMSDNLKDVSENLDDTMSESLNDAVPENLNDADNLKDVVSDHLNDAVTDDLNDAMSDHLNETVSENQKCGVSDNLNDAVSDSLNDTLSESLNRAASVNLNEAVSENLNVAVCKNVNDAESDNLNDTKSENFNQAVSINLNDGGNLIIDENATNNTNCDKETTNKSDSQASLNAENLNKMLQESTNKHDTSEESASVINKSTESISTRSLDSDLDKTFDTKSTISEDMKTDLNDEPLKLFRDKNKWGGSNSSLDSTPAISRARSLDRPRKSRELNSLLALAKEANLDTNIAHKRKIVDSKESNDGRDTPKLKKYKRKSNHKREFFHQMFDVKTGKYKRESSPTYFDDVSKPQLTTIITSDKDAFCWQCHKDNVNEVCSSCPRAYHTRCVKVAPADGKWLCPECMVVLKSESTSTRSPSMEDVNIEGLSHLLKFALKRIMQILDVYPFINEVKESDFPDYKNYIIQPMTLTKLGDNIDKKLYVSTTSFEADIKWIVHNSVIYNSSFFPEHTKLTSTAKTILKVCKQEMAEIENCPTCYKNANTYPQDWFVRVCPKPHLLLWAKLKGFPYWPAKAMKHISGQVDVRFFGAHDRAWLSYKDCLLYGEQNPNTKRYKKNDISECLLEVKEYINNLVQVYGEFVDAPFRTMYLPKLHTLRVYLPRFDEVQFHNKIKLARAKAKWSELGGSQATEPNPSISPAKNKMPVKKGIDVIKIVTTGINTAAVVPVIKKDTAGGKINTPVARRELLSAKKDIPTGKKDTPVHKKDTPVHKKDTPVHKKDTSVLKNDTIVHKKDTIVYKKDTIVENTDTSVLKSDTPVQNKATPVDKKDTLIQKEDTPVEKKDAPVQNKDTLVLKKNMTVEKKDISIETKDILDVDTSLPTTTNVSIIAKIDTLIADNETAICNKDTPTFRKHSLVHKNNTIVSKSATLEENYTPHLYDTFISDKDTPVTKDDDSSTSDTSESTSEDIPNSFGKRAKRLSDDEWKVPSTLKTKYKEQRKYIKKKKDQSEESNEPRKHIKKNKVQSEELIDPEKYVKKNKDQSLEELNVPGKHIKKNKVGKIKVSDKLFKKITNLDSDSLTETSDSTPNTETIQIIIKEEDEDYDNVPGKEPEDPDYLENDLLRVLYSEHVDGSKLNAKNKKAKPARSITEDTEDFETKLRKQISEIEANIQQGKKNKIEKELVQKKGTSLLKKHLFTINLSDSTSNTDSLPEHNPKKRKLNSQSESTQTGTNNVCIVEIKSEPESEEETNMSLGPAIPELILLPQESMLQPATDASPQPTTSKEIVTTAATTPTVTTTSTVQDKPEPTKKKPLKKYDKKGKSGLDLLRASAKKAFPNYFQMKQHQAKKDNAKTPVTTPTVTSATTTLTVTQRTELAKPAIPTSVPPNLVLLPQMVLPGNHLGSNTYFIPLTGITNLSQTTTVAPTNSTSVLNVIPTEKLTTSTSNTDMLTSCKLPVEEMTSLICNVQSIQPLPISERNEPVYSLINAASNKLSEQFRDMMVKMLGDMSKSTDNPETTITNLRLEIEMLKRKQKEEIVEIKKNVGKMLHDVEKSLMGERERITKDTKTQMAAEMAVKMTEIKRKQWCANCLREASFYCCWNTSYCNYPCQAKHWPRHMGQCTQNGQNPKPLILRPALPPPRGTEKPMKQIKILSKAPRIIKPAEPPVSNVTLIGAVSSGLDVVTKSPVVGNSSPSTSTTSYQSMLVKAMKNSPTITNNSKRSDEK